MARGGHTRWQPGQSGNPSGRRKGTVLAMTRVKKMIEDASPEILERQIALAKRGNPLVARYLIERLVPIARSAPIETPIALPENPADQADAILAALAAGDITQESAQSLLNAVRICQEVRDAGELASRLAEIERRLGVLTGEPPSPPPLPERPKAALPPPRTGSDEF
jgi:uncharacterized protein DUF5681